ncbi:DUF2917 domain-containing protein [Oryzomonas sagensis]|uniref:DUF2917 domain-containing protein n=1 Tax=Oryzomonas sagensis TaxID=2603857 RepID=A0ABQ6TUH9_9BACT|nr:DUF2917 domain-containing protein [Oryzomonas sagensis]KAB0672444.1 DUF2917 domain-containing protein [Oryzomonas sagensis]
MDYLLKKGETAAVTAAPAGCSLRMDRGSVWLTRYDDPRDYVLGPGETFTVSAPGTVVIEALEDTTFTLGYARIGGPARTTIQVGLGLPSPAAMELH